MRIEAMNPAPESAVSAPGNVRAGSAAMFMGLLGTFDAGEAGPEGASSRARKQLSDPLGLATSQALTSAPQNTLSPADAGQTATPESSGSSGGDERAASSRGGVDRFGRPGSALRAVESRGGSGDKAGHAPQPGVDLDAGGARPSDLQALVSRARVNRVGPGQSLSGMQVGSGGRVEAAGATSGTATGSTIGPARVGSLGGGVLPGFQPSPAKSETFERGAKPTAQESILRQEKAEIAPQISKGLASLLLRRGGSVQIQLRPEALGRVRIDLTIKDSVVNATISAEHQQARQLLGNELARLRMMLEHRGLRVERLEIASPDDEPEALIRQQDASRGSWRTPAEDGHRGVGTEADNRSSGDGDHERAWDGDPHGRSERRRPNGQASAAESDAVPMDGLIEPNARRSPVVMSIRLDTMA